MVTRHRVNLSLSDADYKRLLEQAGQEGKTPSTFALDVLKAYMLRNKIPSPRQPAPEPRKAVQEPRRTSQEPVKTLETYPASPVEKTAPNPLAGLSPAQRLAIRQQEANLRRMNKSKGKGGR